MNFVKVISSTIVSSIQKVKFLRYGSDDVQEKKTIAPYGVDSNPIKDMVGLYIQTDVKGESVLVGYINKSAVAQPGEIKLFSTNSTGEQQAYIHFKNDGNIHFNGDEDNMVRWLPLNANNEAVVDKVNELITNWNQLCTTYVPGGPSNVGLPASLVSLQVTALSTNIDDAKIDAIKTSMED